MTCIAVLLDGISHRWCSIKKGALRNFAKFTGKHLGQSLFFNKVGGLRPATLLKKRTWHSCFPVSFAKFLRTLFLQNIFGPMLLTGPNQGPCETSMMERFVKKGNR